MDSDVVFLEVIPADAGRMRAGIVLLKYGNGILLEQGHDLSSQHLVQVTFCVEVSPDDNERGFGIGSYTTPKHNAASMKRFNFHNVLVLETSGSCSPNTDPSVTLGQVETNFVAKKDCVPFGMEPPAMLKGP